MSGAGSRGAGRTLDIPMPRGFRRNWWLRVGLGSSGVLLIASNLLGVLDTETDAATVHLARHQSAFKVALGLALLYVAWRVDRAYGMVPFAVTFTLAIGASAIIDLVRGASSFGIESLHVVELAGLAMLWLLGWIVGPRRRTEMLEHAPHTSLRALEE
jgi:predicted anti-sigma-YlaC factor YlaD